MVVKVRIMRSLAGFSCKATQAVQVGPATMDS